MKRKTSGYGVPTEREEKSAMETKGEEKRRTLPKNGSQSESRRPTRALGLKAAEVLVFELAEVGTV
jgi:hypothetical protein